MIIQLMEVDVWTHHAPPKSVWEIFEVVVVVFLDEVDEEGGEDQPQEPYVHRGDQLLGMGCVCKDEVQHHSKANQEYWIVNGKAKATLSRMDVTGNERQSSTIWSISLYVYPTYPPLYFANP